MNNKSEHLPDNPETEKALRIRTLNDAFRTTFVGGKVMFTQGIQALGTEAVQQITRKVQTFSDFSTDNDPYGEHDFGSVEHDGHKVFWKMDYYDDTMSFGSEEPSDPTVTTRVLTVMLAEEY